MNLSSRKIDFDDMIELIGVENARKIRAVVEGAKRSVEYGFMPELVFDTSALISLEVVNLIRERRTWGITYL
ncbi:hypothetical protein C5S39_05255 [Candidatus Methanophagaceae archaeon]|nr:hypothetical protein C5S39_05255 [Methanophagales archaeon]